MNKSKFQSILNKAMDKNKLSMQDKVDVAIQEKEGEKSNKVD